MGAADLTDAEIRDLFGEDLRAELDLLGHAFEVTYRVQGTGFGPTAIVINGTELPFSRGRSPYRAGAADVPMDVLLGGLAVGADRLSITLGEAQGTSR